MCRGSSSRAGVGNGPRWLPYHLVPCIRLMCRPTGVRVEQVEREVRVTGREVRVPAGDGDHVPLREPGEVAQDGTPGDAGRAEDEGLLTVGHGADLRFGPSRPAPGGPAPGMDPVPAFPDPPPARP